MAIVDPKTTPNTTKQDTKMIRRCRTVCEMALSQLTAAVTGPPPRNYDFKTRAIGGSRSPHGYSD
jgi:hypothetical protein